MAKKAPKRVPVASKPKAATPRTKPKAERFIDGDKAFSKHVGKSTKTVQNWRDKGMPFEELEPRKYRYHLDQTEPWIQLNGKDDEDSDERKQLRVDREKARLRSDIAKAMKVEREEQEAQGNILPRDVWESFVVELVYVVRGMFLQIPKQSRRHCCSKCAKTVPVEMEKLITKALHKLASVKNGPPKDERTK